MFNRRSAILLAILAGVTPPFVRAQSPDRLPVMGTIAYSRLWFDDLERLSAPDADGSGAFRLTGRVAVPVQRDVYVGLAVESWRRTVRPELPGLGENAETLAYVTEATNVQVFAQVYPLGARRALFARAGVGLSRQELLSNFFDDILATRRTHALVSAGVGYDVSLVRSVYLTPAVDYSRVLAEGPSTNFGAIRRGVGVSLGVTFR